MARTAEFVAKIQVHWAWWAVLICVFGRFNCSPDFECWARWGRACGHMIFPRCVKKKVCVARLATNDIRALQKLRLRLGSRSKGPEGLCSFSFLVVLIVCWGLSAGPGDWSLRSIQNVSVLIFMPHVLSLCLCTAHSFVRVTQQSNQAMPAAGGMAAPERAKMANRKIKLRHMCHWRNPNSLLLCLDVFCLHVFEIWCCFKDSAHVTQKQFARPSGAAAGAAGSGGGVCLPRQILPGLLDSVWSACL